MVGDNFDYYKARAEQELTRARDATDLGAAMAHRELAALYLNRAYSGETVETRVLEAASPAQPA